MREATDIKKHQHYIKTIKKVVVKYGDGSKKTFSAADWFLHESAIRNMFNTEVMVHKKGFFRFLFFTDIPALFFSIALFYNLPESISLFFSERYILFILAFIMVFFSVVGRIINYKDSWETS